MESECKRVIQKQQNSGFLFILQEAARIYFKNFNFVIFTFLASIPLFGFTVYYENYLQETLFKTWEILAQPPSYFGYYQSLPKSIMKFSKDHFLELSHFGLLYLVPLHVLEPWSAIFIVDLASKVSVEDKKKTLKEMFQNPIGMPRFRGTFITSIYVIFLSSFQLIGLLWICMIYFFREDTSSDFLFTLLFYVAFMGLLRLYLQMTVTWNMGIVISILDGIYGFQALANAAYLNRNFQRRGLFLMLIFFAWGQSLRMSCLHFGCYKEGNGIVVQAGLSCMLIPLKWVVCMTYFYDCKERKLEKKVDEELGKESEAVHETIG